MASLTCPHYNRHLNNFYSSILFFCVCLFFFYLSLFFFILFYFFLFCFIFSINYCEQFMVIFGTSVIRNVNFSHFSKVSVEF